MNQKKIFRMSLIFNTFQIVLVSFVIVYDRVYTQIFMTQSLYSLMMVMVMLNVIISFFGYYGLNQVKKQTLQQTINHLELLNHKLKEQRHDYINHLQVVYSLLELEEYEEAKQYIQPIYKGITQMSQALKTYHPAVNALLQAKLHTAEVEGITMYLEIKADLKWIVLAPWELCKVLSNIIDNAIKAVKSLESPTKQIHILCLEHKTHYEIIISNNGPMIPKALHERIFEAGFTTKKADDHGMGLAIVKDTLENVEGTIKVDSNEDITIFTITIPKKEA